MTKQHVVLCRGLALMTWYTVGRAIEVGLLCAVVWKSIVALEYSDTNVVCPGKVALFVRFIVIYCSTKLVVCACDAVTCERRSEAHFRNRTALDILLALLTGLVGQLCILGACDQPLNDVAQLYVTLQYATAAWLVPCLLGMLWLPDPAPGPAPPRTAPERSTPRPSADEVLRDAFNGESPVLVLDDEEYH